MEKKKNQGRAYYGVDVERTGRRLWFLMTYHGLTVKEVAEFLGMENPQGVYHWLRGRNCPSLDNLYALGELFEVPLDLMVCGNRSERYSMVNRRLTYYGALARKERKQGK